MKMVTVSIITTFSLEVQSHSSVWEHSAHEVILTELPLYASMECISATFPAGPAS